MLPSKKRLYISTFGFLKVHNTALLNSYKFLYYIPKYFYKYFGSLQRIVAIIACSF